MLEQTLFWSHFVWILIQNCKTKTFTKKKKKTEEKVNCKSLLLQLQKFKKNHNSF